MDRPDTMIELHREVVESRAAQIFAGDHYDQDVDLTGYTGKASVTVELDHVWFIFETVDSLSSGTRVSAHLAGGGRQYCTGSSAALRNWIEGVQ